MDERQPLLHSIQLQQIRSQLDCRLQNLIFCRNGTTLWSRPTCKLYRPEFASIDALNSTLSSRAPHNSVKQILSHSIPMSRRRSIKRCESKEKLGKETRKCSPDAWPRLWQLCVDWRTLQKQHRWTRHRKPFTLTAFFILSQNYVSSFHQEVSDIPINDILNTDIIEIHDFVGTRIANCIPVKLLRKFTITKNT